MLKFNDSSAADMISVIVTKQVLNEEECRHPKHKDSHPLPKTPTSRQALTQPYPPLLSLGFAGRCQTVTLPQKNIINFASSGPLEQL
jgi:hypothetical protein